jgi:inner membrane protein
MVAIPYKIRWFEKVWDKEKKRYFEETKEQWRTYHLAPKAVRTQATVKTEMRYRGIYGVPVYSSELAISGQLSTKRLSLFASEQDNIVEWGKPYLSVGVSDSRGIANQPQLTWGEQQLSFAPGTNTPYFSQGVHALLPGFQIEKPEDIPFQFQLSLRGMEKLMFTPSGLDTRVSVTSDWQHPSFLGGFLPSDREADETGFRSSWKVSSFASKLENQIQKANRQGDVNFAEQTFGVSLVDPVDVYTQSERSVKYGFLFIGLTFIAYFLFEVLKQLRIHPVQYSLVGLALSFFYLLLIALSEHIGFSLAYALGTLASSGLLVVYSGAIMRSMRLGLALGGVITGLYAMLYVILQSEDHALLMGSLLLFGLLAILMVGTRHLDWYEITERMSPKMPVPKSLATTEGEA